MCDDSDNILSDFETCEFYQIRKIDRARKRHSCEACYGVIQAGASYFIVVSKPRYGRMASEKICVPCREIMTAFGTEHESAPNPVRLKETLISCGTEKWMSRVAEMDQRGRGV